MFIAKITNDYDIITFLDYDNLTLCNCTNNDNSDNNIEITIPLFTITPMWSVTNLFNISHGIHNNQTFIRQK